MKSLSVITIIKESKALFLFVLLSIITHTSIFLINPTFSFTISDRLEGSKGRFLLVELRKEEGKVLERGKIQGVQKFRSSEVQKRKERAAIDKYKKEASTPEKIKDILQVGKKESPPRRKSIGKPVGSQSTHLKAPDKAQAMAQEVRVEGISANGIEGRTGDLEQPLEPVSPDLSFHERAMISGDKSGITEDRGAVSVQPSEESEGHPGAGPMEQEVAQESEAIVLVEKAADQPAIVAIKEVAEKGEAVQTSEPHPFDVVRPELVEGERRAQDRADPLSEGEEHILSPPLQGKGQGGDGVNNAFSGQNEIAIEEPEKEDGKSEVMVSEGRPGSKESSESEEPHPHPVPLPEVEGSQRVQMDVKIEATEKEKEPAKVIEQNVEPPAKKKKRTLPFHKMLEPEKEATIGIPVGRPVVKITTPSKKKVIDRIQGISGKAQGNGITRVILSINGEFTTVPVQNGRFRWDSVLKDGKNIVSATVWDMEGYSATDSVTVEVLSPKNSFALSIDEPSGDLESPVAVVRGRVGDLTVDTVRVILNGRFVEVPVEDGQFEKTVLFEERENTLEAEASNPAGIVSRSRPLRVNVRSHDVPDILIYLSWSDTDVELKPSLAGKERSGLGDEGAGYTDINLVEMMSALEGYGEKVFAARGAGNGAYALNLSGGRGTDCKVVVILNSPKRKVRVFEKTLLEGEEWAVGRFLLPEGVFWEEDEWFSGKIEDNNSITKYKSPEGVTWKELKEGY